MVLEGLINPALAKNKASQILFYGFVYGILAFFLSTWIFSSESSMVMIFLAVLASLPLVYNLLRKEEEIGFEGVDEKFILKQHSKTLKIFTFLFFGLVLAFTVSYFLSSIIGMSTTNSFSAQLAALQGNNVTGQTAGVCDGLCYFNSVFFNNLRVMIFALLFSFLFGSGAIFILTWNASVIGAAIGISIKAGIAKLAAYEGWNLFASYVNVTAYGLSRYIIHGVPEILAYFVAGLAGGIISVAIIRHDFLSKKFNRVLFDSVYLILIALLLIIVSAILEVWVTPLIF